MPLAEFAARVPRPPRCGGGTSITRQACDDGNVEYTWGDADRRFDAIFTPDGSFVTGSAQGNGQNLCEVPSPSRYPYVDVEPFVEWPNCSGECRPCPPAEIESYALPYCDCTPCFYEVAGEVATASLETFCSERGCPSAYSSLSLCNDDPPPIVRGGCGVVSVDEVTSSGTRHYYFGTQGRPLLAASEELSAPTGVCAASTYIGGEIPEPCPEAVICDICGRSGDGSGDSAGGTSSSEDPRVACDQIH